MVVILGAGPLEALAVGVCQILVVAGERARDEPKDGEDPQACRKRSLTETDVPPERDASHIGCHAVDRNWGNPAPFEQKSAGKPNRDAGPGEPKQQAGILGTLARPAVRRHSRCRVDGRDVSALERKSDRSGTSLRRRR